MMDNFIFASACLFVNCNFIFASVLLFATRCKIGQEVLNTILFHPVIVVTKLVAFLT